MADVDSFFYACSRVVYFTNAGANTHSLMWQVKGTRAIDVAFVQNAMDIVIVGEQWAHATANIEAGIAVAKVYELCDCCYS